MTLTNEELETLLKNHQKKEADIASLMRERGGFTDCFGHTCEVEELVDALRLERNKTHFGPNEQMLIEKVTDLESLLEATQSVRDEYQKAYSCIQDDPDYKGPCKLVEDQGIVCRSHLLDELEREREARKRAEVDAERYAQGLHDSETEWANRIGKSMDLHLTEFKEYKERADRAEARVKDLEDREKLMEATVEASEKRVEELEALLDEAGVIRGKDAERFIKEMNRERTPEEKEAARKYNEECRAIYERLRPRTDREKMLEALVREAYNHVSRFEPLSLIGVTEWQRKVREAGIVKEGA